MSWLERTRRKVQELVGKRNDVPEKLWITCPKCAQMIHHRELEQNQQVCTSCGHHMRLGAKARLVNLFDDGKYERIKTPAVALDPLKFKDSKKYTDRLKDAKAKTGEDDALAVAKGRLGGRPIVAAVQNFAFMGGSMGMALGEAFVKAAEVAVDEHAPLIMFSQSGGARMQESILSLMQMPRTTVAIQWLKDKGLPYIVVLTDPTTGGVTASYAMLGDIHIAEPGATIGFAGRRVIENTIREQLPDDFQSAEYLAEHGMVDMVVSRHELRDTLIRLTGLLMDRDTYLDERLTPEAMEAEAANDTDEAEDMVEVEEVKDEGKLLEPFIPDDPGEKKKAPAKE